MNKEQLRQELYRKIRSTSISERLEAIQLLPKLNKGLRVLVWVNLYLLEHRGKDFQSKIFLIS